MSKHIRTAASLFLILFLSFEAAGAQEFGRNKIQHKDYKWMLLSTPHFDIYYYEGEEAFSVRTGLILEDGYKMLAEKLDSELPWKVPVILYASHNDFLQTNVSLSMIQEGVQAFAEPSRKRIVLPFTGSFNTFKHTAVHELAHVFTFNIVYNRLMDSVFSRNYLFAMPSWLAEGLAEYLSIGWDADSDMFIRDAVMYDYLVDLDYVSGFYTYKEGQSVLNFIADTYGREKILDILRALGTTRNAGAALERTIGINVKELNRKWQKHLRAYYWTHYADKQDVEDIGRRLTNHIKDHGYYNTKPVFSPDGETIVFFSDRDGLMDLYLMSALDGKIIRKLVSGYRTNRFESLHSFTSSLCFSPDGSMIAFVAKSEGEDKLYIIRTKTGKVIKKIDVHADALAAPDWSPLGDAIVMTVITKGQSDIVLIDVETGAYKRLTNDASDQLTPRFLPDGKRIVFTYYPDVTGDVPSKFDGNGKKTLSEMDFLAPNNVRENASLDIYLMNLETGAVRPLVQSKGDDTSPLVLKDGKSLLFTSNETGINDLYIGDIETGEYHRITDVLGGLFTPDVNEEKGRITFSAFVNGGWDIYVSDDFKELIKNDYSNRLSTKELVSTEPVPADSTVLSLLSKARVEVKRAQPDTAVVSRTTGEAAFVSLGDSLLPRTSADESTRKESGEAGSGEEKGIKPEERTKASHFLLQPKAVRDTTVEGITRPVRRVEVKSRGATVSPYKIRLSPDYIGQGAGLYFSTGLGFGLSNTIALSDILGNHRAIFSFNLYRGIEDSDFLLSYYYLKKRIDYGFGVFQFKNFLNSRISSIGENFLDYRLFTERNYGVFALMSIPFNTFYRMDIEFQGFVSDREFFDQVVEDPLNNIVMYVPSRRSKRRLIEPTLSFVHDASFFSYFGPVEGSRWNVSLSKGIAFGGEDVSRTTAFIDYRWYTRLFYRNSFALRMAFAGSEGTDPRSFFLGGPVTLRGYDYLEFQGTRLALLNLEYRYPMIDALILGWPTRWGFSNVGGTLFFDAGAAWNKGDITAFKKNVSGLQLQDVKADFGFGTYLNLGYFLLNLQLAWPTDLHSVGSSQFHFFLGPAF